MAFEAQLHCPTSNLNRRHFKHTLTAVGSVDFDRFTPLPW